MEEIKITDIERADVPDALCHDCKKPINESSGFATYNTKYGVFYKCDVCYEKDDTLRNYVPCEVYSRIVGYLRPVENWNNGKQQEFKDRVNFKQA